MNALGEGFMENAQGHLVPKGQISDLDLQRDSLVRDIVEDFKDLREAVQNFRIMALASVEAHCQLSAEKYGHKPRKKAGGDIILNSFDGSLRVVVANDDTLAFNEQLATAKAMIFECIAGWTASAGKEIQALVAQAFKVTRKGQLSMSKVLGLRQVKIEDEKWQRAMQALTDAIQVTGSRTYIRVYQRTTDDQYALLPLDGGGREEVEQKDAKEAKEDGGGS